MKNTKEDANGEACSRSKRDCTHHNHNIRGVGDFRHTHTEICKVKWIKTYHLCCHLWRCSCWLKETVEVVLLLLPSYSLTHTHTHIYITSHHVILLRPWICSVVTSMPILIKSGHWCDISDLKAKKINNFMFIQLNLDYIKKLLVALFLSVFFVNVLINTWTNDKINKIIRIYKKPK